MKNIKKIMTLCLALMLTIGLTACNQAKTPTDGDVEELKEPETVVEEQDVTVEISKPFTEYETYEDLVAELPEGKTLLAKKNVLAGVPEYVASFFIKYNDDSLTDVMYLKVTVGEGDEPNLITLRQSLNGVRNSEEAEVFSGDYNIYEVETDMQIAGKTVELYGVEAEGVSLAKWNDKDLNSTFALMSGTPLSAEEVEAFINYLYQ